MPKAVRFYVWGTPASRVKGAPDHTWVTTFDCRTSNFKSIGDVVKAKDYYWFCWGIYHRNCRVRGDLAQKEGDLTLAKCLALPNVRSHADIAAQGTIFRYGIDGVCHQLANQVLYATGNDESTRLTVANARGYWHSAFLYGTYGRPQAEARFLAKVGSCKRRTARTIRDN